MKIKDEKFISWVEAKKILEKRAADGKELVYEQKNALEHLKKFSKISNKKISELINELSKIEKLKERHIMNIINILPETIDEIRMLFSNEMVKLTEEDEKRILKTVKKGL